MSPQLSSLSAFVLVTIVLAACEDAPRRRRSNDDLDGPVTQPTVGTADPRHVSVTPPTGRVDAVSSSALEVADVNDDGAEDFFVLCGDAGTYEGDADLCAFDGNTFEGLWRVGPMGPRSLAYSMHIERVGRTLAAIAPNGRTLMLDMMTGELKGQLKLPDRAELACAPDDSTLWVGMRKESGRIALSTNTYSADASATPVPRCACLESGEQASTICLSRAMLDPTNHPKVLSSTVRLHVAGDAKFVMAIDGTPRSVISLPIDGGTPLWSVPVAPGDPLMVPSSGTDALVVAGNRVFASYDDANHKPHIVALDANTGTRLWDVVTKTMMYLSASAERVYVQRWGRIDVRDAKTGALLGGVGTRDAGDKSAIAPARREIL